MITKRTFKEFGIKIYKTHQITSSSFFINHILDNSRKLGLHILYMDTDSILFGYIKRRKTMLGYSKMYKFSLITHELKTQKQKLRY